MNRFIDTDLKRWAADPARKPLLLRGARQVGKTFAVRQLGASFDRYVEVNFEEYPRLKKIFDDNKDLDPFRIVRDLSAAMNVTITPGRTLLFFDETQVIPRVILALRYFYEKMPALHVIAAGSLLDFAIEKVGVPVGRIEFYTLHPMSFLEFLKAGNEDIIFNEILNHEVTEPQSDVIHEKIISILREYLAIGGMPEVVLNWFDKKDPLYCAKLQHNILNAYRQDFNKYAKTHQIKYVELIFEEAAKQLGGKFNFNALPGEYRKRELMPALDLLVKAGVIQKIYQSNGQGIPIGATANHDKFKVILLDVGLTQALLGLNLSDWLLEDQFVFINKGAIVEAFVGQELLVYSPPDFDHSLYYWQRDVKGSEAELDYLVQLEAKIIPIEVKSDKGKHLKSMHLFLKSHADTPFGIRLSLHHYSVHEAIYSYPLYAVAAAVKFMPYSILA